MRKMKAAQKSNSTHVHFPLTDDRTNETKSLERKPKEIKTQAPPLVSLLALLLWETSTVCVTLYSAEYGFRRNHTVPDPRLCERLLVLRLSALESVSSFALSPLRV
jgi:hypothetical protein